MLPSAAVREDGRSNRYTYRVVSHGSERAERAPPPICPRPKKARDNRLPPVFDVYDDDDDGKNICD